MRATGPLRALESFKTSRMENPEGKSNYHIIAWDWYWYDVYIYCTMYLLFFVYYSGVKNILKGSFRTSVRIPTDSKKFNRSKMLA